MASFRRSTSILQRDGAAENGDEGLETFPSPKPSHTRTYLILGRWLNSLVNSLDLAVESDRVRASLHNVFMQRSSRSVERSKARGPYMRGTVFRIFICFLAGIFIGFAPIPVVDISKNSLSRHQAFSFQEEPMIDPFQKGIVSEKNDFSNSQKTLLVESFSLGTSAKLEEKNLTAKASSNLPLSYDVGLATRKLLIIVTPTYSRPFQSYFLNQLAQTLRNVQPPLLWIVVEMPLQSPETANMLRDTGVMYRHLVCDQNVTNMNDRGIHQRNVALSHIQKHQLDGIVHFADDDRAYAIEIFDEMREIRRFGTWPVAVLIENKKTVSLEGPVCKGGQVIGWHTNQGSKLSRRFHVDMSGFAFNSSILWDPKRWNRPVIEPIRQRENVKDGFRESKFVEELVEDESQMEGLAENCSRILVWHLHLEAPELFIS